MLNRNERIIRFKGTRCRFQAKEVVGRLTIYTSSGEEIGPFGYNGDPTTFEEQLAFLATFVKI